MKRIFKRFIVVGIVGALGFALGLAVCGGWGERGNLAVVEIRGPILESKTVVAKLDRYLDDPDVRAIVLRIDSPGGIVGAAQEIFEAVNRAREGRTVVASIGSVGASGGYYIACAADKIFANPGSLTGSIGVLMEHVDASDLLAWARLKSTTFKSGALKDMGSATRPVTPEEELLFAEILRGLHRQFERAVASRRGLDEAKVRALADGRVYTGEEALERGLIDAIGGLQPAIDEAGRLAGIPGKPKVIYPEREGRSFIQYLVDSSPLVRDIRAVRGAAVSLPMYLWKGILEEGL